MSYSDLPKAFATERIASLYIFAAAVSTETVELQLLSFTRTVSSIFPRTIFSETSFRNLDSIGFRKEGRLM